MTRSMVRVLAVLGFVAASGCGSTSDNLAVPITTKATTVTAAPATTTTSSTTTTSTTTSTSASTTTTTTLPSTLDIDGAPLIEFSVEVDDALAEQLDRADLVGFVI